jgi:hypothetical protein
LTEITEQDFRDPVYFQKAVLNVMPYKKQREILRDPAKDKYICAGRRGGKTKMIAGEIIRGSFFNIFPRQTIFAPTYKQTDTIYNEIVKLITDANKLMLINKYVRSPRPEIHWYNGAVNYFYSTENPNTIRGDPTDRVFLDEANFILDKAMPAIRPMIFDTAAPIWATTTPWTKNWFHKKYMEGLKMENPLKLKSFHFTSLDNPYIDKATVEQEILDNGGMNSLYVRTEILGEYVEDVDMYFKDILISDAVDNYKYNERLIDALNCELLPKHEYVLGVDIAHLGEDSTVYIVLKKSYFNDLLVVDYVEEVATNTLDIVIDHIKALNHKFNFTKVYLDYTGMGTGVGDVLRSQLGYIIEPVLFTNQSKMDMFSNLTMLFTNKRLVIPQHNKLIYQLRDLRYEKSGEGNSIKIHHPVGGHDDFPCALALAAFHYKPKQKKSSFSIY